MAHDGFGLAQEIMLHRMGLGRETVEEKIRTDFVARTMFEVSARTLADMMPFDMNRFSDGYASIRDMQEWADSIMKMPPHFTIGGDYMQRWYILPRNDKMNLYLHRTLRSDDDVMHDHPWHNVSFVIRGGYIECMPDQEAHVPSIRTLRKPGDIVERRADDIHRLELIDGQPSVSLFFTGPKIREWGFHCRKGWVHWRDFTGGYADGRSDKGAGCGEFA